MCNQLCNVLLALVLVTAGLSNPSAQTYGSGSRCVEHSGTWQAQSGGFISSTSFQQSGCYQVCVHSTYIVIISLNFIFLWSLYSTHVLVVM